MTKTYDCILLLTGENEQKRYRSKKAIELFNKGLCGSIFVSGGQTGLLPWREKSEADLTVEYLLARDIPAEKIFYDGRSRETLGNFTFPAVEPIEGNPSLKKLESILLVTEEKHVDRIKRYAPKIIEDNSLDYEPVKGDYNPGLGTALYNIAILRALSHINAPNPELVHRFLLEEHPFYQDGWFELSIKKRKRKLMKACAKWIVS